MLECLTLCPMNHGPHNKTKENCNIGKLINIEKIFLGKSEWAKKRNWKNLIYG